MMMSKNFYYFGILFLLILSTSHVFTSFVVEDNLMNDYNDSINNFSNSFDYATFLSMGNSIEKIIDREKAPSNLCPSIEGMDIIRYTSKSEKKVKWGCICKVGYHLIDNKKDPIRCEEDEYSLCQCNWKTKKCLNHIVTDYNLGTNNIFTRVREFEAPIPVSGTSEYPFDSKDSNTPRIEIHSQTILSEDGIDIQSKLELRSTLSWKNYRKNPDKAMDDALALSITQPGRYRIVVMAYAYGHSSSCGTELTINDKVLPMSIGTCPITDDKIINLKPTHFLNLNEKYNSFVEFTKSKKYDDAFISSGECNTFKYTVTPITPNRDTEAKYFLNLNDIVKSCTHLEKRDIDNIKKYNELLIQGKTDIDTLFKCCDLSIQLGRKVNEYKCGKDSIQKNCLTHEKSDDPSVSCKFSQCFKLEASVYYKVQVSLKNTVKENNKNIIKKRELDEKLYPVDRDILFEMDCEKVSNDLKCSMKKSIKSLFNNIEFDIMDKNNLLPIHPANLELQPKDISVVQYRFNKKWYNLDDEIEHTFAEEVTDFTFRVVIAGDKVFQSEFRVIIITKGIIHPCEEWEELGFEQSYSKIQSGSICAQNNTNFAMMDYHWDPNYGKKANLKFDSVICSISYSDLNTKPIDIFSSKTDDQIVKRYLLELENVEITRLKFTCDISYNNGKDKKTCEKKIKLQICYEPTFDCLFNGCSPEKCKSCPNDKIKPNNVCAGNYISNNGKDTIYESSDVLNDKKCCQDCTGDDGKATCSAILPLKDDKDQNAFCKVEPKNQMFMSTNISNVSMLEKIQSVGIIAGCIAFTAFVVIAMAYKKLSTQVEMSDGYHPLL